MLFVSTKIVYYFSLGLGQEIYPDKIILRIVSVQARKLIADICANLNTAAKSVENVDYTVVLRGDSTLRGHFPEARAKIFPFNSILSFISFTYSFLLGYRKPMQPFLYWVKWMHG